MRLLIIRHGDPDYANDTLTEKGRREATLLAKRLQEEKIDHVYSSPLGRAHLTCEYVANAIKKPFEVKDWLKEFHTQEKICYPTGEQRYNAWDILPEYWTKQADLYDETEWKQHSFYKAVGMQGEFEKVTQGLDELLQKHGYVRDGKLYRVERSHRETIALFCHFGVEMVLLSHLFGISPLPLWHHFIALPTSVTTLYTEERREGKATFRCSAFGSTEHLYMGGEAPSFSGRFCETIDGDERH